MSVTDLFRKSSPSLSSAVAQNNAIAVRKTPWPAQLHPRLRGNAGPQICPYVLINAKQFSKNLNCLQISCTYDYRGRAIGPRISVQM
jgi:hypothetical protein